MCCDELLTFESIKNLLVHFRYVGYIPYLHVRIVPRRSTSPPPRSTNLFVPWRDPLLVSLSLSTILHRKAPAETRDKGYLHVPPSRWTTLWHLYSANAKLRCFVNKVYKDSLQPNTVVTRSVHVVPPVSMRFLLRCVNWVTKLACRRFMVWIAVRKVWGTDLTRYLIIRYLPSA